MDTRLLYRFFTEDLAPERESDPKFDQSVKNLVADLRGLFFSDEWRTKAVPLFGVLREIRRDWLEVPSRSEKERDVICGEVAMLKYIIDLDLQTVQASEQEDQKPA